MGSLLMSLLQTTVQYTIPSTLQNYIMYPGTASPDIPVWEIDVCIRLGTEIVCSNLALSPGI